MKNPKFELKLLDLRRKGLCCSQTEGRTALGNNYASIGAAGKGCMSQTELDYIVSISQLS